MMISLDIKADLKVSLPLSHGKESTLESSLSFADLLKGVKTEKSKIENGSFLVALNTKNNDDTKVEKKSDIPLSLLHNESKLIDKDILELNPTIIKNMTPSELKILIREAKQFLKDKIILLNDFKISEVKNLPKTLKGLQEMAKSFGIEINKITLEDVRTIPKEKNLRQAISKSEVKEIRNERVQKEINKEVVVKGLAQAISKSEVKEIRNERVPKEINREVVVKGLAQEISKSEVKEIRHEIVPKEINKEVIVVKGLAQAINKSEVKEIRNEIVSKEINKEVIVVKGLAQAISKSEVKEIRNETVPKEVAIIKEFKGIPLFKEQEKIEFTHEKITQTKQFIIDPKTIKSRADDTLKLLLRGDRVNTNTSKISADFSVLSTPIIVPNTPVALAKSLESLLHSNGEESISKLDGLNVNKTDSFEVKINEAKQMIKYLSQDVKASIEDYKSPFTRIRVQLNPDKMGEIDVTIVQRGKNLHVNLSANTAAINTLAIHVHELKSQLNTNGIQNASLNFNNSDQNAQEQTSHHQQNHKNERGADEEYKNLGKLENEEQVEEILSSLEIIVPNYA